MSRFGTRSKNDEIGMSLFGTRSKNDEIRQNRNVPIRNSVKNDEIRQNRNVPIRNSTEIKYLQNLFYYFFQVLHSILIFYYSSFLVGTLYVYNASTIFDVSTVDFYSRGFIQHFYAIFISFFWSRHYPFSKKCHLAIREKGVFALWLYLSFMGLASSFILVYWFFVLRVNVSKDQSRLDQGSVDLADFHRVCSVFHADSRGAIRFS